MALDKFKRGCPYGAEVAAEVEAGGGTRTSKQGLPQ